MGDFTYSQSSATVLTLLYSLSAVECKLVCVPTETTNLYDLKFTLFEHSDLKVIPAAVFTVLSCVTTELRVFRLFSSESFVR